MPALSLAGQQIGQMIIVQNLEPAVDDSGMSGKHFLGTAHEKPLGLTSIYQPRCLCCKLSISYHFSRYLNVVLITKTNWIA
jgi:hypothetical protein